MITRRNNLIISILGSLVFILGIFFLKNQLIAVPASPDYKVNCVNSSSQLRCWENQIKQIVKTQGLSAAFDQVAVLYETEPNFVSECHSFTHELGTAAYQMFAAHQSITLTPKTSYCGYGFYHGFMETLLQSGVSIAQAREFCAYADKQLLEYTQKTNIACYHGIGHGAVDGTNLAAWGDPQALIAPALKICREVSDQSEQIYQCGSGVFNSLAIATDSGSYKLTIPADPYAVCASQEEGFKKSCYEQMNTEAMTAAGGNFGKAIALTMKIKDPVYARIAVENISPIASASKLYETAPDYSSEIKVCQTLVAQLRTLCVGGLVGGILEFGKPDLEYTQANSFCKSAQLTSNDREDCYQRFISSLGVLYSQSKSKEICSEIDSAYQKYCEPYE